MMLSNSSKRRRCRFSARYVARESFVAGVSHHPVNIIVLLLNSLGRGLRVYLAHYAK